MSDRFSRFITALGRVALAENACNQYTASSRANQIRRQNLRLYLEQMYSYRPTLLLVGEAPGYRGCRLTGVPFTSEAILLQGVESLALFGAIRGYQKTAESDRLGREATATILWETLGQRGIVPLLWNAFPFHPFQAGCPYSNRPPTRQELEIGQLFLTEIVRLFQPQKVVAMGNYAAINLKNMGIIAPKVRHPANGGKAKFQAGLDAILNLVATV